MFGAMQFGPVRPIFPCFYLSNRVGGHQWYDVSSASPMEECRDACSAFGELVTPTVRLFGNAPENHDSAAMLFYRECVETCWGRSA